MSPARLTAYLLLVPALSQASSLLQRSASRQRAFAGLRYSPQDPAARTLLTLDTNQDGRIDPKEVAAFARSQGLDASAATQEFSSIDTNGDGTLDSAELQKVLAPATELTSTEATVEAPAAPSVKLRPAASEQVVVEAPLPASVAANSAPAQHVEVAPPIPLVSDAAPVTQTVAAAVPQQAPAAVQATEAQVATATQQAPAAVQTAEADVLASTRTANDGNAELISEESRNSIRMAAEKVAQELQVEEEEEHEARDFDRKAAEVRANSTALAKLTIQDALDAGTQAAHAKADELMAEITKLEEQAERAEVRAAALRAKSKMELEEGNHLMAAAEQALKQ